MYPILSLNIGYSLYISNVYTFTVICTEALHTCSRCYRGAKSNKKEMHTIVWSLDQAAKYTGEYTCNVSTISGKLYNSS